MLRATVGKSNGLLRKCRLHSRYRNVRLRRCPKGYRFAVLYRVPYIYWTATDGFRCCKKQAFFFQVKAQNFFHHPFAGGQWGDFDMLFARAALKCLMSLWSLRFGQVEQIEMVVTVPLTLINKLGTVPRQEQQAVHRFHVFGMFPLRIPHPPSCPLAAS